MADIEVKPRSVLPTYRDSRQVSLTQVLANCSREKMLKLLGSARCQHNDLGARVTFSVIKRLRYNYELSL